MADIYAKTVFVHGNSRFDTLAKLRDHVEGNLHYFVKQRLAKDFDSGIRGTMAVTDTLIEHRGELRTLLDDLDAVAALEEGET